MSKHLPARRTRSDPGSADQPSRIPRPIFTGSRSSVSPTITKSSPKGSRSPKINVAKKSKVVENSKSNSNKHSTCIKIQDAPAEPASSETELEQNEGMSPIKKIKIFFDDENSKEIVTPTNNGNVKEVPSVDSNSCNCYEVFVRCESDASNISKVEVFNNAMPVFENSLVDSAPLKVVSKEISGTNPFRMSETNPFKGGTDCKNPFLKITNPFEDTVEEISALQSKGQISSTLIPPPIPERPSLKAKPALCQQEMETESTSSENISPKIEISIKSGNDNCVIDAAPKENAVGQRVISPVNNRVDTIKKDEATNEVTFPEKSSETSFWSPLSPEDSVRSNLQQSPETQPTDGVSSQQRPIEDILQALDQLVLSAPREVEISIDWGTRGHVNIREKAVVPSTASGNGSTPCEMDGLSDDRRRCIEDLLKEVDECLRMQKGRIRSF
ncbi:uncharacterized protein LOC118188771 [Stegodyphus dumicola]|uniref:uncharacterized protein LOC118188771 n=1 Tax=Stegodyphus dumicola TaxID=202533 RepID=UPI0015AAA3A8|nr:uncharacterized protein LOC118188771 [Stegodyphus dumicola]